MRPLPLFYILVFYIIIQFGWWTLLLVDLNNEVTALKTEMLVLQSTDQETYDLRQKEFQEKLHKRWLMVIGEGSVFMMFLTLGIINVRRALKKEEELSLQQKNFLHAVTHELKSPLASIKLYLQTLDKREVTKEKQSRFIHHAISDTDRLTRLVDNLLLAARMENKKLSFRKEMISLSEVFEECANRFVDQPYLTCSLQCTIEKNILIRADKTAMFSLLNNLLENAVKYSPSNSVIEVKLESKPDYISLQVIDQGQGISSLDLQHIFQKFYRAGNEETRSTKGTGLGLFIVQQIAEGHQAQIAVRQNSPKGTIFEVQFKEKN